MHPFFQLINVAIGNLPALSAPLTEEQWDSVLQLAKKQALLGIVAKASEMLPPDQNAPRKPKIRLALAAEKIVDRSKAINRDVDYIFDRFKSLGREVCLLKGQGVDMLYPWRYVRQSGDIDLWVKGDRDEIIRFCKDNWTVGDIWNHHCDVHAFKNGTQLEVHFIPTWMNNPFHNRILQKYFEDNADVQFANRVEGSTWVKPTIGFDCVFSMIHIYRHLMMEGIGLRQIMDYYFILKASTKAERDQAMAMFERLSMKKFVAALMYILQTCFMLGDDYLMCEPDMKYGEAILRDINKGGNFGVYDSSRFVKHDFHHILRAFVRFFNILKYINLATSEVLWSPYFRVRQFLWRIIKGYNR